VLVEGLWWVSILASDYWYFDVVIVLWVEGQVEVMVGELANVLSW